MRSAMVVSQDCPCPRGAAPSRGKVTYTGTPPKMKPIDMSKEPSCAKQHATPVMTENVATGPANTLQFVVVYISAGDTDPSTPGRGRPLRPEGLPVSSSRLADARRTAASDFQRRSDFAQHPSSGESESEWNKSQPAGSPPIDTKYDKPEFIPVKCNIHPWMHGYFVVLNTSHYSVTGQDGAFSFKGLPAGKYTVTAWQEQYGTQTQEVTVGAGESKAVNFTFQGVTLLRKTPR